MLFFLYILSILVPISLFFIFKAAKEAEGTPANDPLRLEEHKWQAMINRYFDELAPLYKKEMPDLSDDVLLLKIEKILSFHLKKEPQTILRSFYEISCLYKREYPYLTPEEILTKVEKTLSFQPEIYLRARILQFLELAYSLKKNPHISAMRLFALRRKKDFNEQTSKRAK